MSNWCGERETHGPHELCRGWAPVEPTPCPSCDGRWYVQHQLDCPDYLTASPVAESLTPRGFSRPGEDDPRRDFMATYFDHDDDVTRGMVEDYLDRIEAAAVRELDELRAASHGVLPEVISEELPGVLDGEFTDNIDRLKNIGDRWQRLRAALHREDGA